MSKIKKINVSKKNWRENLTRLLDFEINPHSKGLSFNISIKHFLEIIRIKIKRIIVKTNENRNIVANIRIY